MGNKEEMQWEAIILAIRQYVDSNKLPDEKDTDTIMRVVDRLQRFGAIQEIMHAKVESIWPI